MKKILFLISFLLIGCGGEIYYLDSFNYSQSGEATYETKELDAEDLEGAFTEAYEIINGKIGSPIKGATLIGDGPSILKEVSMVGNDMMLDPGIGTCGKAGQGVPVGVAQPSILINKMTVGGTKL